jgi:hypothetical protein
MMSKRFRPFRTTVDVTVGGEDLILDVDVDDLGNDGIGPYECHGYRGYDHGRDYVEDFTIVAVRDAYGEPLPKKEQADIIHAIGNDDALIEGIQTDLDERLGDMMDNDDEEDRHDEQ